MNLTNHYTEIHEFQSKFSVVCGIDNCQHAFKFVSSFQSHILRKHPEFYESNVRVKNRTENNENFRQLHDSESTQDDVTVNDNVHCENSDFEAFDALQHNFDFLTHFARFLLRIRE